MFGAWTEQQLHLKQNEGGADWEANIAENNRSQVKILSAGLPGLCFPWWEGGNIQALQPV